MINIIHAFAVKTFIIVIVAMIEAIVTEPSFNALGWILSAWIWIRTVGEETGVWLGFCSILVVNQRLVHCFTNLIEVIFIGIISFNVPNFIV